MSDINEEQLAYDKIRRENCQELAELLENHSHLPSEEYLELFLQFVEKKGGYSAIDFNFVPPKGGDVKPPLMHAIIDGHPEVAKLILDNVDDLDVNFQDEEWGGTLLIFAAGFGYPELVEILLKREADQSICENHGKTALDCAKEGLEEKVKDERFSKSSKEDFKRVIELLSGPTVKSATKR